MISNVLATLCLLLQLKPKPHQAIMIALISWFPGTVDAAIEKLENRALFQSLCTLMAAADQQITTGDEASAGASYTTLISKLNMTLAPPEWQSIFKTKPGKGNWHETIPTSLQQIPGWSDTWPRWLAAAKAAEDSEYTQQIKTLGVTILATDEKNRLQQRLMALAARDASIQQNIQNLVAREQAQDAKDAQKLLKEAAYGTSTKTRAQLTSADIFAASCDTTTGNCCKDDTGKNPPPTIAGVMACVCLGDDTVTAACVNPGTPLVNWNDGTTSGHTKWQILEKFCSGVANTEEPEVTLETTLTHILANAHFEGGKLYLGARHSGACHSNSGNAFCVSYTAASATDTSKLDSQEWVTKIKKVIKAIKNSRQATTEARQLKARRMELEHELVAEIAAARVASQSDKKQPTETDTQGTTPTTESCASYVKGKTECEKTGKCKWEGENETKGECKHKPGSDTPATGAGDGATGTTTDKCKDKKKDDCKSPDCKWEGKECKDSSILASKQLALTLAAALVSCVAF
uniref:Variant surface glycoprotein 1125.451 n=1 Tax=Trypanosoma brucei TaxID=5691 RepID=A0A1J0R5W6_9TRYP|nr:variant surface glycoprotein 1125.451 [Trypanosoma brucei]